MQLLLKSYIQNEVYNVRIFFKIYIKGNNSYIQERVNLAYIPSMMIYKVLLT